MCRGRGVCVQVQVLCRPEALAPMGLESQTVEHLPWELNSILGKSSPQSHLLILPSPFLFLDGINSSFQNNLILVDRKESKLCLEECCNSDKILTLLVFMFSQVLIPTLPFPVWQTEQLARVIWPLPALSVQCGCCLCSL